MDIFDRISDIGGNMIFPVGGFEFEGGNGVLREGDTYDLSNLQVNESSVAEICNNFHAIPQAATSLNLSNNNLNSFSAKNLATIFAAIPPHITTVILSNNNLHNKSEAEWIEILNKLPNTLTDIRSEPAIPILGKIQKTVAEQLTPDHVPAPIADIIMGYAVNTRHFKRGDAEQKPEVSQTGFFSKLKNIFSRKTASISEGRITLR